MTFFHALLLGTLQGLTEFLPVSSSGHLVLAESLLRIPLSAHTLLSFDVLLHAATMVALLACYARTWWGLLSSVWTGDRGRRRVLAALLIATLPAAAAGVFLEDIIADALRSSVSVGLSFLATALILIMGERCGKKQSVAALPGSKAFLVGCAQACALVPGLSRSGLTISMGRCTGLSRSEALDFSFLLAAPIIAGAVILALPDIGAQADMLTFPVLAAGFCASLVSSIIAILFLRRWVRAHSFTWFALYLIPAGITTIAFL
ncbi:UDP-diphosphatase [Candidatus Peregrinibacteria bacterium CG10_big_fil_rev_8_21_14_0_10_55_24]|nr:MAG: UDP-diphosphatase [Candidatus Peregrinibacteria bacterium CG10_big_fil_rev_8_21_14_0_10_55_24]